MAWRKNRDLTNLDLTGRGWEEIGKMSRGGSREA